MRTPTTHAKRVVRTALRRVSPRTYAKIRFNKLLSWTPEPELVLVPELCRDNRLALDVGAADGLYALHLAKTGSRVIAFEPRPDAAIELTNLVGLLDLPVEVVEVALSDQDGSCEIRVPRSGLGRSTIETLNPLPDARAEELDIFTVCTRRLDSMNFREIGFIKIDVEGHEMAALRGMEQSIRAYRPNVLIEVENRHNPHSVQSVSAFFAGNDYSGFFITHDRLSPIAEFDPVTMQDPNHASSLELGTSNNDTYINNFVFIPRESAQALRPRLEHTLSREAKNRQSP